MLISILCSVLSVHIISWVGNDGMRSFAEWLEANSQWMTLNKLLSLGVAFFSAFTMFNWWLSYRLFTLSLIHILKAVSRKASVKVLHGCRQLVP